MPNLIVRCKGVEYEVVSSDVEKIEVASPTPGRKRYRAGDMTLTLKDGSTVLIPQGTPRETFLRA